MAISRLTEHSTRDEIVAELLDVNDTAKSLKPSPFWEAAHRRINQLLDWIVGR